MIQEIISFYLSGILLAFTPCVLPVIPLVLTSVIGQNNLGTTKANFILLTYILSMSLTYASFGVLAGLFGESISSYLQTPLVMGFFSVLFLYLGLRQFNLIPPLININNESIGSNLTGGSHVKASIMGVVSTIACSPCISAPMLAALSYIMVKKEFILGGVYLFILGLGIGTVFLLVGLFGRKIFDILKSKMKYITGLFGIFLLGMSLHYGYNAYTLYSNQTQSIKTITVEQKTILYFHAVWCENCKEMDKLFKETEIIKLMKEKGWVLKIIDLTDWKAHKDLIKKWGIIGVPTIILTDNKGNDVKREVGAINKDELMRLLK